MAFVIDVDAVSAHLGGMKASYFYAAGAITLTFVIAACVAGPDLPPPIVSPSPAATSQPAAAPAPVPTPTSAPAPAPPPELSDNWIERPQTPGSWEYVVEPDETFALFSAPNSQPLAIIR